MKEILLLCAAVAAVVFVGCSKDNDRNSIDLEIKVGETYSFDAEKVDILSEPNEFYASADSQKITGKHAGNTYAEVLADGVTYGYNISVAAKNTLYTDLGQVLGAEWDAVVAMYGQPLE